MNNEKLIAVSEFCTNHHIEISFIQSLQRNGLLKVVNIQQTGFLGESQFQTLEKIARLHYELDINIEGIETIMHLLSKTEALQLEIIMLKNKLRLYEAIDELESA